MFQNWILKEEVGGWEWALKGCKLTNFIINNANKIFKLSVAEHNKSLFFSVLLFLIKFLKGAKLDTGM